MQHCSCLRTQVADWETWKDITLTLFERESDFCFLGDNIPLCSPVWF